MHNIVFELKNFADAHREGSYVTQANRKAMLLLMGEQLWQAGYKAMKVADLKGRHVNTLLAEWRAQGLTTSTIKNRMSTLRVTDCNRNRPGLQSRHFWDRIICLYPSPQDRIICL